MKKVIFVLSLILVSALQYQLFAQNIRKSKSADTYILTGSINNDMPITMILTIDDENTASGRYYYHNQNKYIDISGKATINGAIVLDAIVESEEILEDIAHNNTNNNSNSKADTAKVSNSTNDKMEGDDTGEKTHTKYEFIGTFDSNNITLNGELINVETEEIVPFSLSKNKMLPINHIEIFGIYYYEKFSYQYKYIKFENKSNIKGLNTLNKHFENTAARNEIFLLSQIKNSRNTLNNKNNSYSFDVSTSFVYANQNIVTLAISTLEYMGGSNTYGGLIYYIYNIQTGALLSNSISNLIADKNNTSLINLLQTKLLENHSKNDFSKFDTISLNDNFYIDASGVHFVYNEREIAPYAIGKIFVSFTFDELEPFVSKTSPFYYLFN